MTLSRNVASGLLAPEDVQELLFDPLEAASIAAQATTILYTESHSLRIPLINKDPQAAWVAEGEEINVTDPEVGEAVTTPKKVAGITTLTAELLDDAVGDTATRVGNGLARDVGRRLDGAFFATTAPADGPGGLGGVAFSSVNAGTENWVNSDPFVAAVFEAESNHANISAWFINPSDAANLSIVKESQGSQRNLLTPDPTIPGRRMIEGRPVLTTTDVAVGEVWGIDQTQAFTVIRKDAEVVADHSAFFTSDRIALRAVMRAGFLFINETGVVKIKLGSI